MRRGQGSKAEKPDGSQASMFAIAAQLPTGPCVPTLREAVKAWQAGGYKGVTETTRALLNYWFATDHRLPNGTRFEYYPSQREAIETLIFVWEVEKVRTRLDLLKRYGMQQKDIRLPPYDEFARYCTKMATGSGKTKVMSLAVAWQFLNAVRETGPEAEDYAKTFLLIAPNVIVLERLKTDFAGGRVFSVDPIVPKEMEVFWDFDCVMRGEGEKAHAEGSLFLTNIQQFYERRSRKKDQEPDDMAAVLGPKPPTQKLEMTDFGDRIGLRGGRLLVLNDEAHHTHQEDNEWNKVIRGLHADRMPIAAQLDFTATPRFTKGAIFPWTVSDYPLKQAIVDNVVKRPYKGIAKIEEAKSDHASVRYRGFLVAGVRRWREYRKELEPLDKKPILFIMLNSTDEADEVGAWLRGKFPGDFKGDKTLVIHTDTRGEIKKSDLDAARKAAREVDQETSPVNAIVSVLMLREGWDVQNVTVVVGLRPYSAKANILPEQTIGRGLRLMFRARSERNTERVDVIGNPKFLEFVDELDALEGLGMDTFEVGKDKLQITSIYPVAEKQEYDIALPTLTPTLTRKKSIAEDIAALDVSALATSPLPLSGRDAATKTFTYEGYDIITLEKEFEREYTLPPPQTAQEVIGYYSRRIAQELRLPSQFAALAPKVREFFATQAFGKTVDLEDRATIAAMSTTAAHYVCVRVFVKALRECTVEEQEPQLLAPPAWLSETQGFPWSGPVWEGAKCVLNLVPCDNAFERDFAKFLDKAEDVAAFTKLALPMGFAIDYTDTRMNLRLYYPDFVAVDGEGSHWLIETKGQEDVEVACKDKAARLWCENATALTGTEWHYVKVRQTEYGQLAPQTLNDLRAIEAGETGLFAP